MKIAIQTKYLGPTNTQGARIKAWRHNEKIVVPYDYAAQDAHLSAVRGFLRKLYSPYKVVKIEQFDLGQTYVFVVELE